MHEQESPALSHPARSRGTTASGLYLVTPDEPDDARLLSGTVPLLPFAAWLQYRNKTATRAMQRVQIKALLPLCRAHGVPLLVNDDWRLAIECGAAGAHLGEDDGDLREARVALGPEAIIGASCYDSLALAERAVAAGASYVAFGAFFPTTTKTTTRRATTSLLQAAVALKVPRVAIGGITPDNARPLVAAGADLLAVIGGVFEAPDPIAAARAYAACFPHPTPRPQSGEGAARFPA